MDKMKVLVATEKPFSKVAVDGIKAVTDAAGYELVLLEKYTELLDMNSYYSRNTQRKASCSMQ